MEQEPISREAEIRNALIGHWFGNAGTRLNALYEAAHARDGVVRLTEKNKNFFILPNFVDLFSSSTGEKETHAELMATTFNVDNLTYEKILASFPSIEEVAKIIDEWVKGWNVSLKQLKETLSEEEHLTEKKEAALHKLIKAKLDKIKEEFGEAVIFRSGGRWNEYTVRPQAEVEVDRLEKLGTQLD